MPIIQSNMPITRQQLKMTCPNLVMKLCTANTHFFHPQRHLSLFWKSQFLTPSSLMMVAYLRFRLDPVLKYRPEHVMYKHKIVDTWLEFQQWQQTPPVSSETRYIHVGGSRDPGLGSYFDWPYSMLQMGQNTLCQTRRGPGLELIEIWLTPPGLRGASEGATMSTTLSGLDAGTKLSFSGAEWMTPQLPRSCPSLHPVRKKPKFRLSDWVIPQVPTPCLAGPCHLKTQVQDRTSCPLPSAMYVHWLAAKLNHLSNFLGSEMHFETDLLQIFVFSPSVLPDLG